MSVTPILAVHDLTYFRHPRQIFSQVTFTLGQSELLHITGANGSGKTSLLRILAGLVAPTQGEVMWQEGQSAYGAFLAYQGHQLALNPQLTVSEQLKFSLYPNTRAQRERALIQVGLLPYANNLTCTLSRGQQQRLAFARLLLADKKVWLLDEPFTALDQAGVGVVQDAIREKVSAGGAVILTSHQPLSLPDLLYQSLQLEGGE